jgi:hypothetical protein
MTRPPAERQAFAIARAKERSAAEHAALVAEVDAAVATVGWRLARPVVAAVLPGVVLCGPRGRWRRSLRKRSGRRLLAGLAALPIQGRLALAPVTERGRRVRAETERRREAAFSRPGRSQSQNTGFGPYRYCATMFRAHGKDFGR